LIPSTTRLYFRTLFIFLILAPNNNAQTLISARVNYSASSTTCGMWVVQAQTLVYTLLGLMPTSYQRDSLQAMLGLFLEAQGHPLPQHSQTKSPSALSRFLNQYDWGTRQIIRAVRKAILQELLTYAPRGRRPWLQAIVDLTTLEKCGKFKAFEHLIHFLYRKRGLRPIFRTN
jgi:hypothetical protein